MGEATYFLKIDGGNAEKFEKVKQFFHEGSKAEDYWQNNRKIGKVSPEERDEFWSGFEKKFPLVAKYTKFIGLFGGEFGNDPAGKLDFGQEEEIDDNLHLHKNGEIWYSAYVWHFAEWDGFVGFMEDEFGLTNGRWLSDEYLDPFEQL